MQCCSEQMCGTTEPTRYEIVLTTLAAASASIDRRTQITTVPLAIWALSATAGIICALQNDDVSAYCGRLLRASLPPKLLRHFFDALATGLTAILRTKASPTPTCAGVRMLTAVARATSGFGNRKLQVALLWYFAAHRLATRPECHSFGAALVSSAILLSCSPTVAHHGRDRRFALMFREFR